MTRTIAAALALALPISAASAQPDLPVESGAAGPNPPLQITTTFQARIDGAADARDVPSTTAQDTARRALYTMAANECAILSEYWRADCRLSSFYVSGPLAPFSGPAAMVSSMYGTATYELRFRTPGR
ncbi:MULTISPECIES: hypothetical protein [unclassified Bradyrhizobium]|uniref:hypothetical protein n=1 Tax=unclassified Bradyrhizobium TaxID=2631580 RepID=UPI0028E8545F|nr:MULTISPECIES: hypothetical protein [unclassified Bradyrhizobium]